MNQRFYIFLPLFSFFAAIVLLACQPLVSHAAEKKGKERLAVLDLESKYGVDEGLAEALSIIVRSKLFSFGDYQVMSKSDIMAVATREQLRQALGCDDGTSQCLVNFGRAIGTRFMVAGAISKLGSTYTISLRMLDTKSDSAGVVNIVSESCKCSEDDLIGTAENVAARLVGKYIFTPKIVEVEKSTTDARKPDELTAKTELEQKLNKETELTAEIEKQRQILLNDERPKQEEKNVALEAQRLKLEKETVEAETKRILLDLEEKKKAEVETESRLALEKQKAEELERQRKEEERKRIEAETAKRLEEGHRKEEEKRMSERAEAEHIRLSDEKKRLEEEKAKRSAEEKKLSEKNERQGQVELEKQPLAAESEAEKKIIDNADKLKNELYNGEPILLLRNIPKNITVQELSNTIKEHNFFEKDINPEGAFRSGYLENGNGTVTDSSTGLMWQKGGTVKSMTIYEAQLYVNNLNKQKFCGNSDWRLPTLEELASLPRENQVDGLHIDAVFDRTQRRLWSSDISNPYYAKTEGFDTNLILNLESGSFSQTIFPKFNTVKSLAADDIHVNDENHARAVRSFK